MSTLECKGDSMEGEGVDTASGLMMILYGIAKIEQLDLDFVLSLCVDE